MDTRMTALFVAGAHTDIGKTHVACALLRAARARGLSVEALKPVVSGFDFADWAGSDPGRLIDAVGRDRSAAALDAMSPWIFTAPLAPRWRRRGRVGASPSPRSRGSARDAVPRPTCSWSRVSAA